ncbi:hypothetical protein SEVIR_5G123351v4 [Setaria viridis]
MRTPICISRDAACNIRRSSTTSSTEASSGGAGDSEQQLLAEGEIWQLCAGAKAVFLRQPNLLELDAPINVRGDMHGQFRDLIRILQELGAERVRGRRGTQHRRGGHRREVEVVDPLQVPQRLVPRHHDVATYPIQLDSLHHASWLSPGAGRRRNTLGTGSADELCDGAVGGSRRAGAAQEVEAAELSPTAAVAPAATAPVPGGGGALAHGGAHARGGGGARARRSP